MKMDCFDDLGDKFGRRSRSSSQVKSSASVKSKSKVNKKKKTRMGKMIPFSTCLRLNRRKKRKGSDEASSSNTGQVPVTTQLTIHGPRTASRIEGDEEPGTSQGGGHSTLPSCTDQPYRVHDVETYKAHDIATYKVHDIATYKAHDVPKEPGKYFLH